MSSPSFRKAILTDLAARWNLLFGPSGTTGKWFRTVRRGPIMPCSAGWPILNCQDGGQRRIEADNDETATETERMLTVLAVCQLAEDWTKVDPKNDWSDRVEAIIAATNKYRLSGCGVLRLDYVDDDPADVVFMSGGSAAIWQIEFQVQYFTD